MARLRRSSRAIAFVLLASFWGLAHGAADDVCAADLLQAHDESKHVLGPADDSTPKHCVVCHSIRTPRRPFGPGAHLASPLLASLLVKPMDAPSRRAPSLDSLPARAPPVSLT